MGRKIPLLNHDVTFRVKTGKFINIQDSYISLSIRKDSLCHFPLYQAKTTKYRDRLQGFSVF